MVPDSVRRQKERLQEWLPRLWRTWEILQLSPGLEARTSGVAGRADTGSMALKPPWDTQTDALSQLETQQEFGSRVVVGVQNWGQPTVPGVRDGRGVTPGEHRVGR